MICWSLKLIKINFVFTKKVGREREKGRLIHFEFKIEYFIRFNLDNLFIFSFPIQYSILINQWIEEKSERKADKIRYNNMNVHNCQINKAIKISHKTLRELTAFFVLIYYIFGYFCCCCSSLALDLTLAFAAIMCFCFCFSVSHCEMANYHWATNWNCEKMK